MKETVFIDTGFWIALFDRRDTNHLAAKNGIQTLLRRYQNCLSDFIIFETLTYLNCSVKRHDLALSFLEKVRNVSFRCVKVDEMIKNKALGLFEKYADKTLSMTDCTSFVIMSQKNIQKYAGFDDHFQQMGFVKVDFSTS